MLIKAISGVVAKLKVFIVILMLVLVSNPNIYALGLDGVGTEFSAETGEQVEEPAQAIKEITVPGIPKTDAETQKDTENNAKAIGNMFKNASIDAESIEAANAFIAPFAKILNKIMAVILGITALLMMFVTVLDLLYIAFPPVRDILDGGMNQMQGRGSGMRSPLGMQGGQLGMDSMQGGMMGMQGSMMGQQQQQPSQQQLGGGLSALGRWVSDESIAACIESQGGVKSILFAYLKKRSMFLFLFGVCIVLFTSTVFTDLGVKIGMWGIRIIMGFSI